MQGTAWLNILFKILSNYHKSLVTCEVLASQISAKDLAALFELVWEYNKIELLFRKW